MRFVAGNAQHIGARPQQQDAFGFSDPDDPKFVAHGGFLGVVADGMGGLTHGSEASHSAVQAFLNAYKRKSAGESIPKALTRCLGEANMGVLRVTQNAPAGEEVGTTLVAAVLHDHVLYWVSVGDSRIYLFRGRTLTQLTADHVYAQDLNRQAADGKISLSEALSHPERSSLTSYLGQQDLAHVDKNVHPLPIKDDDCVMLCSDGFYRALTEQELVTGFRNSPQTACDTLLGQAIAKNRRQQDNMTVIALKRRTRSSIPNKLKLALATAAMLLIIVSGGIGYLVGKRFAAATMDIKISYPRAPDTGQPGADGQTGQKPQVSQPPEKAKATPKAAPSASKKDTEGKGGGKEPTASSPQPNENKKKDTAAPPDKDDQTKSPPESQEDNQNPPNQPPKTSPLEGRTQIEG